MGQDMGASGGVVPPSLAEMRKHRGSGLFNRAAGHVDLRPIVLRA